MQIMPVLAAAWLMLPMAFAGRQATEPFSDVPKTHWAYEAVMDLKEKGILVGYPPEQIRNRPTDIKPRIKTPTGTGRHHVNTRRAGRRRVR